MKKYLIFLLIMMLTVSIVFMGMGCKEEAALAEEAVEEEEAIEEEAVEEVEEEVEEEVVEEVETPGVTDNEIVMGFSMVMSGHLGFIGGTTEQGVQACFSKYNDMGGINGRELKLISYDSTLEVANDIANYKKLILEDEVFGVLFGMWTSISAIYPFMEENEVPWLFPMGPTTDMVFPPKEYLFNLFPTHLTQIRTIASWLIDQDEWQKIGVVYSDNEAGKAGLADFKDLIEGSGMEVVAEQAIEEGAVSAAVQVAKLKEAGPDLIFLVGMTMEPAALAIKEAKKIGWDVQMLLYMPISNNTTLSLLSEEESEGLLGSYWGYRYDINNPEANSPKMIDAYETITKYYPDMMGVDGVIEHYLSVEVFIEALDRAGENLTREGLISALESLDNYDMGKGLCTFSPDRREGATGGVMWKVENGQWKAITDYIDAGIE